MSTKEVLGTLSPVYGMATGNGLFGSAVGLLPAIAKDIRDKDKDKEKKQAGQPPQPGAPAMKKGGKVKKMAAGGSASKRADGIAQRGKTRGKFV